MKTLISIFLFTLIGAVLIACNSSHPAPSTQSAHAPHHTPQAQSSKPPLPAFFKDAASIPKPLPPTLSPDKFSGAEVKKAYQVAKEIPETLAQLPCFCYCDRGFGHKSLHSCYEDDHSAGCSTCIEEALMAYKLQKEEKLTPEQVREKIIAKYTKSS
jgi:hypothetical protein